MRNKKAENKINLPEGWRRVRLGEVAYINMGQSPPSNVVNENEIGIPFLQGNAEFTGKYPIPQKWVTKPLKLSRKDDILISVRAPVGAINKANVDYCIGRGLAAISFKSIDGEFGWFGLIHWKYQLETLSQGSTFEAISKDDLKNLLLLISISLPEQRKIAEILGTVDNAIGRTDNIIKKYKRIKQGLMQDLLTRGVVENDELGVMSYELRDEKKHRFKDSPLGRIPEEWEVVELMNGIGGNANLIVAGPFGSNLKVQDYKKTGIPIIRLQNIDENKFIDKDIKFIADKKAKELSYHSFISGDLILAKLGDPIGKTCIVPNNFEYGIVVADVVRIRVNEQYADKRFISYILNFDICRNQLNTDIIGTTRPRVNLDQIRTAKIPFPPLPEQHSIAEMLSQIDETIEKEQKYKQKLERIKQGLMEDLLTGKVKVNHLIKEGMKNVQPA